MIYFTFVLVQWHTYQEVCTSSSQCDSTKGLSCPTTSGQCNCPTTSTAYNCDCDNGILLNLLLYYLFLYLFSKGYYWDNTTSNCREYLSIRKLD